MSSGSAGFPVSLELSNVFPLRQAIKDATKYSLEQALKIARDLRKSGSDLVVEEDLAAILGRVWVDVEICRQFKNDVLRDTAIVSYSKDCALELHKGAGPTLDRAFRNRDRRGYLETVIQLSFLCWTHNRTLLASALHYCLNRRFERDLPEANPSLGFDGLLSTLETLSSQASAFSWAGYIETVRQNVYPLLQENVDLCGTCLPSSLLLSCLDCLCIVQRMPEDYTLTVDGRKGCVTLIVWAHYLLGLSVVLKGRDSSQDVLFSNNQDIGPNVVINGTRITHADPEVCLLDKYR